MIIKERLREIKKLQLKSGSHQDFEHGACVMEAVSYVAGEKWSDHPSCTCPLLTSFAIRLNDRMTDKERKLLVPVIPLLVGTRNDDLQIKKERGQRMAFWAVTVCLPLLTDALNLPAISKILRTFSFGAWVEMREYINSVKPQIRKAADAAAAAATAADYVDYAADAAVYAAATAAYADYAAATADCAAATADYAAAYADYAAVYAAATDKKSFWFKIRTKLIKASVKLLKEECIREQ